VSLGSPHRLIAQLGVRELRFMNGAQQLTRNLISDQFLVRHLSYFPVRHRRPPSKRKREVADDGRMKSTAEKLARRVQPQ
jgi:hypothetical protein